MDPIVKFLRDRRDIEVHKRPLPMRTTIVVNGDVEISTSDVALPTFPERDATISYEYTFKGWNGAEDLLTLCKRYIEEIKRIVADGRRIGFPQCLGYDPPPYCSVHLQPADALPRLEPSAAQRPLRDGHIHLGVGRKRRQADLGDLDVEQLAHDGDAVSVPGVL